MTTKRFRLEHFTISGIPVGVDIVEKGYILAMSADRFASYHKVIVSGETSRLIPWMFYHHPIGAYRRRSDARDEGTLPMSDEFWNAHRDAVRQYVRKLPPKWRLRLYQLGKEQWVPDEMFEARDVGRIVLKYGRDVLFFQRRVSSKKDIKEKGPTKYVYWTPDSANRDTATRLEANEEDLAIIKTWPDKLASFLPAK